MFLLICGIYTEKKYNMTWFSDRDCVLGLTPVGESDSWWIS
jgi:hypothetical protein